MREIIVPNPTINRAPNRRYSVLTQERQYALEIAMARNVTPRTHPRVVDLFAGEAPWAQQFAAMGWDTRNITCIDVARPENPMIQGAQWLYWDLGELTSALRSGTDLPESVENLRGQFDVVVSYYGMLPGTIVQEFFARDGGLILQDGNIRFKTISE